MLYLGIDLHRAQMTVPTQRERRRDPSSSSQHPLGETRGVSRPVAAGGSRWREVHRHYATIKRIWAKGDKVELNFKLEPRVIVGDHKNEGKIAIMYGPLVLAADEALLGTKRMPIRAVSIGKPDLAALAVTPEPAPEKVKRWPHALEFRCNVLVRDLPQEIRLIPFSDAGTLGESYRIWLPLCRNVLADGTESRSRMGMPKVRLSMIMRVPL